MSDIFSQIDAQRLLSGKKVVIIGDSNMRGLYKDIVGLLNKNELLPEAALKGKLERSFCNDNLVSKSILHNGRDFKEERQYRNSEPNHSVDFFFVTRCYDKYFDDKIFKSFKENQPDVIVMNSCVWDITRWGPTGVDQYKENLRYLMKRLKEVLPENCLFIWTTTMPISQDMKGGFLIPQVEFLRHQIRVEVMEANFFAWTTVTKSDYDVLDLHYYMQMNISRRAKDGIHWLAAAMRHVTNYVLTHIALAWDVKLPRRIESKELNHMAKRPVFPEFLPEDDQEKPQKENPKRQKVLHATRRMGNNRKKT